MRARASLGVVPRPLLGGCTWLQWRLGGCRLTSDAASGLIRVPVRDLRPRMSRTSARVRGSFRPRLVRRYFRRRQAGHPTSTRLQGALMGHWHCRLRRLASFVPPASTVLMSTGPSHR